MRTRARTAAVVIVLIAAGLLDACGAGVDEAGSTTTTLSAEDQRVAGQYATAVQPLLRFRQLPGSSAEDASCAGRAVVGAVGLPRFRDAQLTPSELAEVASLDEGGVELSDGEIDALADELATCLPDELGDGFADALGIESDGSFASCFAGAMRDAVAIGLAASDTSSSTRKAASLLNQRLARQVAHGVDGFDAIGFAEGQAAGIRCRWKSQPEAPSSSVTLEDGAEALEAALADELSTPPPDLDAPQLASDEVDCVAGAVVDTLSDGLAESGATARELARYVSGEGPDAIGIEVTPEQAESLGRSFLDCVTQEAILRSQLEVFGVPEELQDDLLACLEDRLPEDSLLDNAALNFELGVAGQATPRGQAILEDQAEAGQACALEVGQGPTTS